MKTLTANIDCIINISNQELYIQVALICYKMFFILAKNIMLLVHYIVIRKSMRTVKSIIYPSVNGENTNILPLVQTEYKRLEETTCSQTPERVVETERYGLPDPG